jgi:hypothetical protein
VTITDPQQLRAPKRQRLVSVTSLIDSILPKPALVPWAERETAEGMLTLLRAGELHPSLTAHEALAAMREARIGAEGVRTTAARRGVNLHGLLERYENDGTWADPVGILDPEDYPFSHALNDWLRERRPEPIEREQLVADPSAGYAGRFDWFGRIDGQLTLLDATTSDKAAIWPAKHYQLRMYERARRVCGDEPADRLLIVVFCKDGTWREMDCLATFRAVDTMLAHHRDLKPVDQACNAVNRAEKGARRDDTPVAKRERRKVEPNPDDKSTMPGALEVSMRRELPDGGLIEYEFASRGWATKDGYERMADWRAYFHTPPAQGVLKAAA